MRPRHFGVMNVTAFGMLLMIRGVEDEMILVEFVGK